MPKNPIKVAMGKKSRASGSAFELRVRKDLENVGWAVDKWSNNIEFVRHIYCKPELYSSYKCERCGNKWAEKDVHPVCLNEMKLSPAKRKYAGPGRPMVIGTGFPDFSCHKYTHTIVTVGDENNMPTQSELQNVLEIIKDAKQNRHTIVLPGNVTMVPEWEVIGVECKTNGTLDKTEKEKCRWLLDNKVFSKILIAEKTKVKNRVVIVYHDFEEKYGGNAK